MRMDICLGRDTEQRRGRLGVLFYLGLGIALGTGVWEGVFERALRTVVLYCVLCYTYVNFYKQDMYFFLHTYLSRLGDCILCTLFVLGRQITRKSVDCQISFYFISHPPFIFVLSLSFLIPFISSFNPLHLPPLLLFIHSFLESTPSFLGKSFPRSRPRRGAQGQKRSSVHD
jgi:hypothetical protein